MCIFKPAPLFVAKAMSLPSCRVLKGPGLKDLPWTNTLAYFYLCLDKDKSCLRHRAAIPIKIGVNHTLFSKLDHIIVPGKIVYGATTLSITFK
jgi:hypothetical protein